MPETAVRETATRPDRRRARNRDAILSAAEMLFGARGIEGVSIDEIADAADIAKGTVYNHFADKDSLAAEIAGAARGDGEARVAAANDGIADPVRRTVRGLMVFARFAVDRPERARAMMRLSPSATDPASHINHGLRADVAAGIQAKRFSGSLDGATLMMLGAAHIIIARLVVQRPALAIAAEETREIAAMAMRALGIGGAEADTIAAAETADIFGSET
jgi:AcrR family transcriptional regulator